MLQTYLLLVNTFTIMKRFKMTSYNLLRSHLEGLKGMNMVLKTYYQNKPLNIEWMHSIWHVNYIFIEAYKNTV